MRFRTVCPLICGVLIVACGGTQTPPPEPPPTTNTTKVVETKGADGQTTRTVTTTTTKTVKGADPSLTSPPVQAKNEAGMRGSRVSASRGAEGGVLVLWPRIIPASDASIVTSAAIALQGRLRDLAMVALPGRSMDLRPAPERVCPMAGCKAVSVGVLLLHQEGGCAAVALVSRPGASPAALVPWSGKVTLKVQEAAFRSPPESLVTVNDFAPCGRLLANTTEAEKAIRIAIEAAGKVK